MTFSERMIIARKRAGMTQSDVAEKLNVSLLTVCLWESGEAVPETDCLGYLAEVYQISLDWLLRGKQEKRISSFFQDSLSDRIFDENKMYMYINDYALKKGLHQTMRILPYARELHKGQLRKGNDRVPYIHHPLLIACHALALGMEDDDIISSALLHDVCEDCGVKAEELPVNERTREAVRLLTKTPGMDKKEYFDKISENPVATMVKLLDRCNNISTMAPAFSKEKIVEYIQETEKSVYPLLQKAKNKYTVYSNQIFLIQYHMLSVIEALKHQG